MTTRSDEIMERRGEIMLRALGMDYSAFEISPISFDYEAMMAAHGYSIEEICDIQTAAGVGHTPLLELRNLTDLVRSISEPGKGGRIFVKDEAANMAGSFKDRRASMSIHAAKKKGYEGVIAATSGNYGAAVASQAARFGLRCIICQEAFDSRHVGQPEIIEKTRLCEAFGAEVVQMTVGPELFAYMLELLDDTGYFAASLYSTFGVSGIETLGWEIAHEMKELTGAPPTHCVITHAGGGNTTGTARGLRRAGASTEIVSASVDLKGLHMASDTDFNRKSFTTGHLARPRRCPSQRGSRASLHEPLPHGHAGRGVLRDRGHGQARRARARACRQYRRSRCYVAGARTAGTGDSSGAGDRVHGCRQTPLGAAQLRQGDGGRGACRRPARQRARTRDRDPREARTDPGDRRGLAETASQLRAQRPEGCTRGLYAHRCRYQLPGRGCEH